MHAQIMELVICIFALPQHSNHAGIKVWQTKLAVWLRQNQMPATDQARSGTGNGGKYTTFDIHTIDVWLSFLLANMYVRFGDQICRQFQETPMGTNRASHLALRCMNSASSCAWLHYTWMLLLPSCARAYVK
ncbi:TPA: hypothetical protein ACH3X1_002361 [Trebouxia sp. C0004]